MQKKYGEKRKRIKWGRIYAAIVVIAALIFALKVYVLPGRAPSGEFGEIRDVEIEDTFAGTDSSTEVSSESSDDIYSSIPEYSGTPTYVLNDNKPFFTDEEYERAKSGFIQLSDLDILGRCGPCMASLGKDMLDAAGERRDISGIHPSGWHQESYPGIIESEGSWLWHRSHLIAHMFAGADPEIDGEKNLITGTEYCNEVGMLGYSERAIKNRLIRKADGGRVLYRVTPVFKGAELVARGVHIEAGDTETRGEKFHINVYCYNVQKGIRIDYLTGYSWKAE